MEQEKPSWLFIIIDKISCIYTNTPLICTVDVHLNTSAKLRKNVQFGVAL